MTFIVFIHPQGGLIQSPPLGTNTWNFYHCNIDENTVKAIVDAIAGGPLKAAGYEYVNIDDCWQVERRPDGTIQPDPVRFPSGMKALADYAHSRSDIVKWREIVACFDFYVRPFP